MVHVDSMIRTGLQQKIGKLLIMLVVITIAGRLFTTFVIVTGVGVVAYSFGSIGQYLISGELRGTLRRRRMQRKIDRLRGHVIVCGFGRVGRRVMLDLEQQGQECVAVDIEPECFRSARLEPGDVLVAIGTRPQLEALRQVA